MRKLFQKLLGVALIACITLSLSSCEELFGEWSKPVPASVVQEAKVLGAALETGATVTVNYSVGSKNYVATFIKNSDDSYTLISNVYVSGARAMTRDADPAFTVPTGDASTVGSNIQLVLVGGKLQLSVKDTNGTPLFEAQMNVEGGEVVVLNTNAAGIDCSVGSLSVNDQPQPIKNPEMKTVNLTMDLLMNHSFSYAVKYSQENNDTWAAVVDRYKNLDVVEIKPINDYISVKFSKDMVINLLIEQGADQQFAEAMYISTFSKTLFLTTSSASDARAMTRSDATATDFVKMTDPVDATLTYSLTVMAPTEEKQFAISGLTETVTLNIPITDGVTWQKILQLNDNLYTVGGLYITINGRDYFLFNSQKSVFYTETYDPNETYYFREAINLQFFESAEATTSNMSTLIKIPEDSGSGVTWQDIADLNSIQADGNCLKVMANNKVYRLCDPNNNPIVNPATATYHYDWKYRLVKLTTLSDVTGSDIGKLVGADGYIYSTSAAASAVGTTAVAMIAYYSPEGSLAIALADESSTMDWTTACSTAAGHTPTITGGTWKLPTETDWFQILNTPPPAHSQANLNTKLNNVGGDPVLTAAGEDYWTSTEDGDTQARAMMYVSDNEVSFTPMNKDNPYRVRAVLAF